MTDEHDSRMDAGRRDRAERGPQQRRRFEAIVADADEGVLILEPSGVIVYANAAAEFLLGHGRQELTGEMFGLPAVPSNEVVVVNVVSRDGRLRLVELRIDPLAVTDLEALVLRLKDVTAYHRSVSDARDEVRQRDEFLSMLSHELRNPLAAIRSAAYLLSSEDLDRPTRRDAADILDRQFRHLTCILDDLLDVSRILRGKLSIDTQRVDLKTALRDAVDAIAHKIADRVHRLQVDVPDGNLWVRGDETRLVQVFVNLLHNAVKFSPRGSRIALATEADAGHAVVRVCDEGSGIPAALLPRVFEPFVQGRQASDRADGGLGIGLMLARAFVSLHGGCIDAQPNPGGAGMVFTVRLPLLDAMSTPVTPVPAVSDGRPLRILLVEDNDAARQMLGLLLRKHAHEVIEAATGPDGLAAALERRPDVALVDIGLPGCDGYEVARRLRQATSPTPPRLIALTGYGTPEDVQAAFEAGFDHHLVKPVHFPDLCRLLSGE